MCLYPTTVTNKENGKWKGICVYIPLDDCRAGGEDSRGVWAPETGVTRITSKQQVVPIERNRSTVGTGLEGLNHKGFKYRFVPARK